MRRIFEHHPSPAMVVAMIALFAACTGGAVAASGGGSGPSATSAASKHKDARQDKKLVKKLAPTLSVAHAKTADAATNASHATSADSATNATHATTADTATNSYTKTQADARFQQRTSRGEALAGATVTPSGVVSRWFNAFDGAPTVTHTASSGVYDITFPGIAFDESNSILQATPDTPSSNSTVINADYCCSGTIVVITRDPGAAFADRGFHLVVFGASAGG